MIDRVDCSFIFLLLSRIMSGDIYVIHLIHRGYYGLFDVKWNWMDEKSSTSKKKHFHFRFS